MALSVAAVGGCDGLLDVELPGEMTDQELIHPEMASMMVNSAIADYECGLAQFSAAIAGFEDAYWESTGWWTRAWSEYGIFSTSASIADVTCDSAETQAPGVHQPFQAARFQAEQAYEHLSEWTLEEVGSNREELLAMSAVVAGYVYQLFGEHWCEITVGQGPVLSPEDALREGELWFDRALDHVQASGDFATVNTPSVLQLAHLGRARVRFALGDLQAAASDAERIDPGFEAVITRSGDIRRRFNQVYDALNFLRYGTIADTVWHDGQVVSTGYRHMVLDENGLPAHSRDSGVPDTRVQVDSTGQAGQDGITPHWAQGKYQGRGADQPWAKWAEAQLILAEAEGGDAAVERINQLRDFRGLPRVTDLGGMTVQDLIIEERRREFFLEGRFHADKLRYDLWFPRDSGFNHKGTAYGPTTCLPLSQTEIDSNPNANR